MVEKDTGKSGLGTGWADIWKGNIIKKERVGRLK